eukprot:767904-Hanusia_phi.AAC.1
MRGEEGADLKDQDEGGRFVGSYENEGGEGKEIRTSCERRGGCRSEGWEAEPVRSECATPRSRGRGLSCPTLPGGPKSPARHALPSLADLSPRSGSGRRGWLASFPHTHACCRSPAAPARATGRTSALRMALQVEVVAAAEGEDATKYGTGGRLAQQPKEARDHCLCRRVQHRLRDDPLQARKIC